MQDDIKGYIWVWTGLNLILLIYGIIVFFYIKCCNKKKLYNINVTNIILIIFIIIIIEYQFYNENDEWKK